MENNQTKSLSQNHHDVSRVNNFQFRQRTSMIQCKEFSGKSSGQNTQTMNNRNERQRINQVNTGSQGGQRPTKSLHSMEMRKAKA